MNEYGEILLDRLNPHFTDDPTIRGTINAFGAEVANMDARIEQIIESIRGEDALDVWEKLFGVPVIDGATFAQRVYAIRLYLRRLSRVKGASGQAWEQWLTELVGGAWRYRDNGLFVGDYRYGLDSSADFDALTFNVNDRGSVTFFDGKAYFRSGPAVVWKPSLYSDSDCFAQVELEIGIESGQWGTLLKMNSTGQALGFLIDDNGTVGIYEIDTTGEELFVANTFADDSTAASSGDRVWLRAYTDGDYAAVDVYLSIPTGDATPDLTVEHTLTGSWADDYGVDVVGGYGMVAGAASSTWAMRDLILGSHLLVEIPDYTVYITLPYSDVTDRAVAVQNIARAITPAHLEIVAFYDMGFVLGKSNLGEDEL